jgi:uncharacterized membrane protein YidH (DUF202 family)
VSDAAAGDAGGERPVPQYRASAVERTRLAWQRSGLSLAVCGLVIARGVPARGGVAGKPGLGLVVLLLGLAAWAVGLRQERVRAKRLGTEREAAQLSDLTPVALGTFLIGLAGLLVDLLYPR